MFVYLGILKNFLKKTDLEEKEQEFKIWNWVKKNLNKIIISLLLVTPYLLFLLEIRIESFGGYVQNVATSISGSILASIAIGFTFSTLAFQTVRSQFTSEGVDLIRDKNTKSQVYKLLTCLVFVCLITPIILANFTLLAFSILLLSVYFFSSNSSLFLGICPRLAQFSKTNNKTRWLCY